MWCVVDLFFIAKSLHSLSVLPLHKVSELHIPSYDNSNLFTTTYYLTTLNNMSTVTLSCRNNAYGFLCRKANAIFLFFRIFDYCILFPCDDCRYATKDIFVCVLKLDVLLLQLFGESFSLFLFLRLVYSFVLYYLSFKHIIPFYLSVSCPSGSRTHALRSQSPQP